MAGKRLATSDLNHDNWNQDEEPEDAGNFSKASDDVLKNRIIKVAKRRKPIGTLAATETEKKGVFASFSGFGKSTSTPNPTSTFGFLANTPTKLESQFKTNGISDTSKILKTSTEMPNTMFKSPETKLSLPPFRSNANRSEEYYAKIKGLNQSVSNWIKKHVDTNPFINLAPIFRDYEKHLNEIENTYKDVEKELQVSKVTHKVTEEKVITSTSKMETQKAVSSFMFKPTEEGNKTHSVTSVFTNTSTTSSKLLDNNEPSEAQKSPKFNFSTAFQSSSSTPNTMFSFGKPNVQPPVSNAGFSFGGDSSKPFMFSNVAKPAEAEDNKGESEEADNEPPKVEFKAVVEEDHIYTIRCKVFVKKNDKFGDRGVGSLYLKPVLDKDKVQLIVRADTNLGNLLCNFILSKNIPTQRMGKKDVMLVCLPMPDSKPPPVPVLFRVKSPEEADELLRTLEKHKK